MFLQISLVPSPTFQFQILLNILFVIVLPVNGLHLFTCLRGTTHLVVHVIKITFVENKMNHVSSCALHVLMQSQQVDLIVAGRSQTIIGMWVFLFVFAFLRAPRNIVTHRAWHWTTTTDGTGVKQQWQFLGTNDASMGTNG